MGKMDPDRETEISSCTVYLHMCVCVCLGVGGQRVSKVCPVLEAEINMKWLLY